MSAADIKRLLTDAQTEADQLDAELEAAQGEADQLDTELAAALEENARLEADNATLTAALHKCKNPTRCTLVGMAGHPWEVRLAETGPVQVRRSFVNDLNVVTAANLLTAAREDKAAGRTSVLSLKVPSWSTAAVGDYDMALTRLADDLNTVEGDVYLAVHHEPAGDGPAAAYAAMQAHVLPLLRRPHVKVCVIVNGFWFSHNARRKPLTDTQLAQWLPAKVLEVCDVVAADCYHGGTPDQPGGEPDELMVGMLEWSDRVSHGKPLGVGEFSGHTADAITHVGNVFADYPGRFVWACVFNSDRNNRPGVQWSLTGDRLTAFQALIREN